MWQLVYIKCHVPIVLKSYVLQSGEPVLSLTSSPKKRTSNQSKKHNVTEEEKYFTDWAPQKSFCTP